MGVVGRASAESRPARGPDAVPGRDSSLEVRELVKIYEGAQVPAVAGISFSVLEGEVVGLLGPNGAGKSTTIGIITTRLRGTSGEVLIRGISATDDPSRARAAIGVTGQSNTLDSSCSVFENLYFHCRYHGMSRQLARERADAVLTEFRLEEKRTAKPATLSGGLQRRLQLARAMAHAPALLLLDEPTNELDATSQAFFWEHISQLRAQADTAVLLATHSLEEAEANCDRVLIMDAGGIILEGRPDELRRRFRGVHTVEFVLARPLDESTRSAIELLPHVIRCTVDGHETKVLLDTPQVPLVALANLVHPLGVERVTTRQASLREVFLDAVRARAATDDGFEG